MKNFVGVHPPPVGVPGLDNALADDVGGDCAVARNECPGSEMKGVDVTLHHPAVHDRDLGAPAVPDGKGVEGEAFTPRWSGVGQDLAGNAP